MATKSLVAALAVALTLTGCSGGDAGSDNDTSGGEQITLRYTWWGNDGRAAATEKAISLFEDENPGIKVQGEFADFANYWDKLATQTAGGDAPDVIQMDMQYLAEYAGRGALLDLSQYDELDTSGLDPNALAAGQINDALVGISTGVNAPIVLANTAMFKEAGIELPDDKTWTWDEYQAIAEKITAAMSDGTYGAESMSNDVDFRVWLRQRGKDMFTDDGKLGFDVADAASWFAEIKKLSDAGATAKPSEIIERVTANTDQRGPAMNKEAMGLYWTNQISGLIESSGSDQTMLRRPSISGKAEDNGMYYKASQLFTGSAKTEHPEAVAKFISFLVNSKEAAQILLVDRGVPINPSVRESISGDLALGDTTALAFIEEIGPELKPAPPAPPVGGSIGSDLLVRYTSEVLFGKQTPEEAGQGVVDELNASIS